MRKSALEEIRRRVNSTKLGPWEWAHNNYDSTKGDKFRWLLEGYDGRVLDASYIAGDATKDFIASSRIDVPRLLDEVDRLQDALWRVRDEIGFAHNCLEQQASYLATLHLSSAYTLAYEASENDLTPTTPPENDPVTTARLRALEDRMKAFESRLGTLEHSSEPFG